MTTKNIFIQLKIIPLKKKTRKSDEKILVDCQLEKCDFMNNISWIMQKSRDFHSTF